MIEVSKNIQETLTYLKDISLEDMHTHIEYQDVVLDSSTYNSTLSYIEDTLNDLYERTRMMQDVVSYAKVFIVENVHTISDECKKIYDDISESIDSDKKSSYITIRVPFEESSGIYKDRDGSDLPKCAIYNNKLTLSSQTVREAEFKNITREKGFAPYKQNLEELKKQEPYRVFYMLENSVKGGLREEIKLELSQSQNINLLGIVPAACEIEEVRYELASGQIEHLQGNPNSIQKLREVKAIYLTLKTDSFKKKTYYVDAKRVKQDFWTKIKDMEYNAHLGINSDLTAAELDELAGLSAFKKEYAEYISKVEDWLKRREAVAKKNTSNGYSDAVPSVDVIVAPEQLSTDKYYNQPTKVDKPDIGIRQPESIYPDSELCFYKEPDKSVLYDKLGNIIK